MPARKLPVSIRGEGRRVGVVVSRFNGPIGDGLLAGALRALGESGVAETDVTIASVPGALVALGAVIRGETYHFEIVCNESARGVSEVVLQFGIPVGNGILTCNTDAQALARMDQKGFEAAQAALELANLLDAVTDD